MEFLESRGANTILMKIGTLVNGAISLPGPRKAGWGQDKVAWNEVVVKAYRETGRVMTKSGQGQARPE